MAEEHESVEMAPHVSELVSVAAAGRIQKLHRAIVLALGGRAEALQAPKT
jgi:hypothetical protein